jgi:hypothetical protein
MRTADNAPSADENRPAFPELGPLILEQKATHAIAWLFIALGGMLLLLGVLLANFVRPGQPQVGLPETLLMGTFVVCSLGCLVLGIVKRWRDRGFALYLHTEGIHEHRASRDAIILFRNAEELKFQSTQIFVHGAYAGIVEHLAVRTPDPESRLLYFQRKVQEPGKGRGPAEATEVDQIAMRIASAIAEKMAARLEKQETLPWTPRMRISLRGVEFEPRRWWEMELSDLAASVGRWSRWAERERGGWPFLEWKEIDRMTVDRGMFRLWARGELRPQIQTPTGGENFHPGYIVANWLRTRARSHETKRG